MPGDFMDCSKLKNPTAQVLIAIIAGISLGMFVRSPMGAGTFDPASIGQIGMLIIRFLKALAVPLIFFAVADVIIRTDLSRGSGIKFLGICLFNSSIACLVALTLVDIFHPGLAWQGNIEMLMRDIGAVNPSRLAPEKTQMSWIQGLSGVLPQHLLEPIQTNNILSSVILAVLLGSAIRSLRKESSGHELEIMDHAAKVVSAGFLIFSRMLRFTIHLAPVAVLALVTQAVGSLGPGIFRDLLDFLLTVSTGLIIQGLIYYPLVVWLVGKRSPIAYLKGAAEAVWTGFALNSSLATVPVTLKCLARMKVDDQAARVSVCGGTNFNNDGVILYEVMTALFLAQAMGVSLDLSQQVVVAVSSIIAAAGIAGVPEAGLVILPIVLANSGFPDAAIAAAIPLVSPVDWILARCRSGVNVLGDMLGAIILSRWLKR